MFYTIGHMTLKSRFEWHFVIMYAKFHEFQFITILYMYTSPQMGCVRPRYESLPQSTIVSRDVYLLASIYGTNV